jgi:hypothetical protein
MFDQIEALKQDFTDKYVVVDPAVPELRRFDGYVGQVKTVNMNGRALVQFDAWNNIGWYDIDVECLKIVPKPAAAPEGKKHEAKPAAAPKATAAPAAGEKKLSPLEMARMQGAAKSSVAAAKPANQPAAPAAGAAKKSTADILAAARGAKAGSTESSPAPAAKLSTADILAAARAKKAAEAPAPGPAPTVGEESPTAAPAPAAAAVDPRPTAAAKSAPPPGGRLSVPEILVWCRQHDAK